MDNATQKALKRLLFYKGMLKMRFIAATWLIFISFTATSVMAQCNQKVHITDIAYAKNSSYFSSKYGSELDDLIAHPSKQAGYLLLEFKVNNIQPSEDVRHYNKWLANRRIERIRTYLNESEYSAPIISKILTASTDTDRSVAIHWCASPTEKTQLRVASIKAPTTSKQ
ncbi:Conserved hypothetical protein [Shewanella piezotolerans WP3]|uniref:OmpA-like domain-containing protein n=1 Tax=Shewanella piezotolerans (strain WP3 / JCM 13877) TaxID=225849 RepID=B8CUB4_SHEPW|nr:hypothetical protein [Shewanella piezotolerans]ACJ30970.1 Conserved hypothetical protein [Shewanella piezotolerans WP3]